MNKNIDYFVGKAFLNLKMGKKILAESHDPIECVAQGNLQAAISATQESASLLGCELPNDSELSSLNEEINSYASLRTAIKTVLDKSIFTGPDYVECTICSKPKKPFGRSAPICSANSYCDSDCEGYNKSPTPSTMWPGEKREDYGFPEDLAFIAKTLRDALEGDNDYDT